MNTPVVGERAVVSYAGEKLAGEVASADHTACPACGGRCIPYARNAARCPACGAEAFTGPLQDAASGLKQAEVDQYSAVVYEEQADTIAEDHRLRLARLACIMRP